MDTDKRDKNNIFLIRVYLCSSVDYFLYPFCVFSRLFALIRAELILIFQDQNSVGRQADHAFVADIQSDQTQYERFEKKTARVELD